MTKLLKIRFVKFEKALAMQILEQEGKFIESHSVKIDTGSSLRRNKIYLRGRYSDFDLRIDFLPFSSNAERDEYLANVVKWITDEQFTNGVGELKVGEICEYKFFCDRKWQKDKLIAILPEECRSRFIIDNKCVDGGWFAASYARPLAQRVEPKIDGDIYTWEMEVAE